MNKKDLEELANNFYSQFSSFTKLAEESTGNKDYYKGKANAYWETYCKIKYGLRIVLIGNLSLLRNNMEAAFLLTFNYTLIVLAWIAGVLAALAIAACVCLAIFFILSNL